jgi:hypothetical protein
MMRPIRKEDVVLVKGGAKAILLYNYFNAFEWADNKILRLHKKQMLTLTNVRRVLNTAFGVKK